MALGKLHIKKIMLTLLWVAIATATIVLSVAAIRRQNETICKGIETEIHGASNNFFIDKKDILKIVEDFVGRKAEGTPISQFNLRQIESVIEKDVWVDNAELFFDRNGVLQVTVEEREPVARVFTKGGESFYIDTATMMLPLSEKLSARLPVFTGFASEARVLKPVDSALLKDIRNISLAIQRDSFLMAMIDQVDIASDRTFEITPKLGQQQIFFGDGNDISGKFSKLKLFYKNVITKTGWNKYSVISLQYKDQVVAKLRGKDDVMPDSTKALQLMNYLSINAAISAADSMKVAAPGNDNNGVDETLIQQSVQRDDEGVDGDDDAPIPTPAPAVNKPVAAPVNKPAPTPVSKPAVVPANKPAAKPAVVHKPDPKPVAKPAAKKPDPKPTAKPAAKKPDAKPASTPKPKVLMPKNNY